jgi:outer membrane protein assembly factor BamB
MMGHDDDLARPTIGPPPLKLPRMRGSGLGVAALAGISFLILGLFMSFFVWAPVSGPVVAPPLPADGGSPSLAGPHPPSREDVNSKPFVQQPVQIALFGVTPQRNLVYPTAKIPATWSVEEGKQVNVRWEAQLGSVSYGGPVVADGKVFVGTNNYNPRNKRDTDKDGEPVDRGILMCFDAATGKFLWQAVHDKLPNAMENDWPEQGVASTPAVDGKRLYYVSNRCELICADTEGFLDGTNDGIQDEKYKDKTDADIVWRLDMRKELQVFPCYLANCSPLIVGDHVYVVTSNGVNGEHKIPAPDAPSFLAVHKHTGKVAWKSNLPGKNILEGQWSNPTYAEVDGKGQVIFPGGDGWLYSFEPTKGDLLWKFDCNPKKSVYKEGGRGDRSYILATPVVVGKHCIVGTGQNPDDGAGVGHLWCIDITKKGDVSPVNDNFDPTAPENKNSALVWHYGGKIEPPPEKGRRYTFGRTLSTVAVHDGLVYAAELDGYLHCLDLATGRPHWTDDLKTSVWCSPLWIDGKVLIGTDEGSLKVYAHGKERKLLAEIDMNDAIKSPPAYADGVLYVQTEKRLYAIAEPK